MQLMTCCAVEFGYVWEDFIHSAQHMESIMHRVLSRLHISLAVLLLTATQALASGDAVKRVSVGSATVLILVNLA